MAGQSVTSPPATPRCVTARTFQRMPLWLTLTLALVGTQTDVFDFLADQRGDRTVVRLADRESGLSARTIARRLSSVSGLYAYLVARGDTPVRVNPVPRGLMTRRQGGTMRSRMAPLVRVPRTLPRILSPEEADRRLVVVAGKGGHHRVVPAANRFFEALGACW
jgi:site-specific recombinase XerC